MKKLINSNPAFAGFPAERVEDKRYARQSERVYVTRRAPAMRAGNFLRSFLASVLALCLAAQAAAALEITAVDPAAIKGAAKGDFNFGVLTVNSVSYEKGAVIMPRTESKGKTFADIKLLSKSLYGKLEGCFKNGFKKPAKAPVRPSVKIGAFKSLKSKSRLANAEIILDGDLLVIGGVMASSREPGTFWVAFPPELAFSDGSFKSSVESAVIAAWAKKNKK